MNGESIYKRIYELINQYLLVKNGKKDSKHSTKEN